MNVNVIANVSVDVNINFKEIRNWQLNGNENVIGKNIFHLKISGYIKHARTSQFSETQVV